MAHWLKGSSSYDALNSPCVVLSDVNMASWWSGGGEYFPRGIQQLGQMKVSLIQQPLVQGQYKP